MSRKLILTPPPAGDRKATKEDGQLSQGKDLAQLAAENEHGRSQLLKDWFLYGIIGVAGCIFSGICIGIVIVVFHMLAPACVRWLSPDEVQSLQKVLGVLLVSGLLADYTKSLLLK